MIDVERVLGSLVRDAMGGGKRKGRKRRRRSSSMLSGIGKGKLGLGALGLAIAAYEQFAQKSQTSAATPAAPTTPTAAPLPPLPTGSGSVPPGDLPPLPGSAPTPPAGAAETGARTSEATLLIRAMIAAANADHDLDRGERSRILAAIEEGGSDAEEREFLLAELDHPTTLAELAAAATSPDLARQVYLASRMAIDVDTTAEENYLAKLAARLGLEAADVDELKAMLEIDDEAATSG